MLWYKSIFSTRLATVTAVLFVRVECDVWCECVPVREKWWKYCCRKPNCVKMPVAFSKFSWHSDFALFSDTTLYTVCNIIGTCTTKCESNNNTNNNKTTYINNTKYWEIGEPTRVENNTIRIQCICAFLPTPKFSSNASWHIFSSIRAERKEHSGVSVRHTKQKKPKQ